MAPRNTPRPLIQSPTSLGQCYAAIRQRLGTLSETPDFEARQLLSHILNRPSSWSLAHPEYTLTSREISALEMAMARVESGEPLPFVLGFSLYISFSFTSLIYAAWREFFLNTFYVYGD